MNPVLFFMLMDARWWWNPFFCGQSQGQKREKQSGEPLGHRAPAVSR